MPSRLQALIEEGQAQGVFPSARAVVMHKGRKAFDGGVAAAPDIRWDLASLTKVICTTSVFLSHWEKGALRPETRLERFFPEAPAAGMGVTLADLLYHRSGLPAFLPYFAATLESCPELLAGCPPSTRTQARAAVIARAQATATVAPRGASAVYSDVGFILLGEALAATGGAPLDALFNDRVAGPLELIAHFRRLSAPSPDEPCAPTGATRPREPAPGQEGTWPRGPAAPSIPGQVDDDNAWVMDGVAGHAGLFGTALDVARFGQGVLEELEGAGRIASASLWHRALTVDRETAGSTRAMGFDTQPVLGHTGFTGTSLWIDPARQLAVALCTNRTLLGRANVAIRAFRPRFFEAVLEELRA